MRNQHQIVSFLLTPTATVAIVVPNEVNGPFSQSSPSKFLNFILFSIDFNQGSRRNDVTHPVIVQANQCIKESPWLQALKERRRQNPPFFRFTRQKVRLFRIDAIIEIQL